VCPLRHFGDVLEGHGISDVNLHVTGLNAAVLDVDFDARTVDSSRSHGGVAFMISRP